MPRRDRAELLAQRAAGAARHQVAVARGGRAAALVVRGQQVALDRQAARVARVAALDHVQPRAVDELLAGLRRHAQLERELVVAEPVELAAQQRVPLRGRKRGDVGEQAVDGVALLEHRVRRRGERRLGLGILDGAAARSASG